MDYDFSGWATRNNIQCSDGRTIMKDAFIQNDGQKVPLVWNHQHNDPNEVLGHALLENRDEGVYAYCKFNETESGKTAKQLVHNGDVDKLSIYANKLKSQNNNVIHGCIREVSLVLAGANPGAFIDSVVMHGEGAEAEEEGTIYTDEPITLAIEHADKDEAEEKTDKEEESEKMDDKEETIGDVLKTLNEKQEKAVYALMAEVMEHNDEDNDEENEAEENKEEKGDEEVMKHNVFDNDEKVENNYLTHADEMAIIKLAKDTRTTLKHAMEVYCADNEKELMHAEEGKGGLFSDELYKSDIYPEYKLLNPGAPEIIDNNFDWVNRVLTRAHKSPISRVRTRHVDMRDTDIKAMGYEKGKEKKLIDQLSLLKRSFDPQTVYVKDKLERDDIIDITDFDIVAYQKGIMERALKRTIATAILIGDGREDTDEDKIKEAHIKSIWNDDELYTIHAEVDIEAARTKLQGTDTSVHFGDNYVYAEAIIEAALYSREQYKGSGALDFYCTPHLLNVMLLARDLNGRRIYNSKADLAQALNVKEIVEIEQFENKTRKDAEGNTHKLLGLFVNMNDYQIGSTKGGQITSFDDFDIDFNQYKYLMETRLSGGLIKPFAAIALEEPVATEVAG